MATWPLRIFSSDRLEQEFVLGTGSQPDSYGGVLEPPLGEEFLPQSEFDVSTVSFKDELALSDDEIEYTAEEWAAWEAGAHDSDETGGAGFYDEDTYYGEDAGYDSGDGYY
ncbi:hypothetical protein CYMTET_4868 [Cymbomonas tetramitiformis]|uniref:Uncharacterized protein n=1 Tax=Cymbomonas tetramitiformis TaxID=36881 RepID=A0AAE0H0I0_9CHLO|nr:hypothetical protein CYMTET_4868 [Cymbomonas tetramitiformis]